jgi:hypothetical protein
MCRDGRVFDRRFGSVLCAQEERRAVEVDERVHVEDARRVEPPRAALSDAGRLELLSDGERDRRRLAGAGLDLDHERSGCAGHRRRRRQ